MAAKQPAELTPVRAGRLHHFGWLPDLPDARDHLYASRPQTLTALPSTVDLTSKCPAVYDQGQLGSCTANAIAGAIEFDRLKQKLQDWVPSRLFIYYNERVIEGTVNSDAGARIRDGIKSVATIGDCPEPTWPYDVAKFAVKPPSAAYSQATKYKTVSYQRVARDLNQMKGCLAEGYPFVYGISVYSSFPMQTATGAIPMPGPGDTLDGGHAMLAVGYEDNGQSFIVRNSWGAGWGKSGYGTLPYAYLLNGGLSSDFWTIRLVQV